MTFREQNLAVFDRTPYPGVFFQPRIEPWLAWNQQFGDLSPRYREMLPHHLFDDLGCSMRYVDYYTGMPSPVRMEFDPEVVIRDVPGVDESVRIYETPFGELHERSVKTVDDTWRQVEHPAKAEDLKALQWLLFRTRYWFDEAAIDVGDAYVGDRGVPQFYLPKSPYQALLQTWMTLPDVVFAREDEPEEFEGVLKAVDASYDQLYEQLTACPKLKILNLGENVHEQLISPPIFEEYYIPWYARRMGQLKAAGIYTHIHMDGFFRNLLPYLADLPFDAIEALTPKPQGDVEVSEMCDALGDKILLDGIPAVLFMETYPEETIYACAEELVSRLGKRLVLGISDEIPEGCGEQGIERVRRLADWCRRV